jgi:stage V sporulation protein B
MRQTFLKGTMVLLISGVISRLLGFVPRIMLPRWIGAEGIGLYQMAYPAMLMLMTLLSGGIPLAVAKLTAESKSGEERHIFKVAMLITLFFGGLLVSGSIACAPWLVHRLFPDERVRPVFLVMCPIVLVIGISSIFRGYYQGKHNMMPTAISQVIESLVRSICILGLALYLLPRGIEYAAAGAMAGVLCGEIAGLLVLMSWRSKKNKPVEANHFAQTKNGVKQSASRLLIKLSIPVTGSRLIGSFSHWMESLVIVHSLSVAGFTVKHATAQYGLLTGMVLPTLLMPGAITFSLAVSLIPALAEAAAANNKALIQKRMAQSIRVALITGGPFAVIMFVLAEPVCRFMYNNTEAAPMLQYMSLISLFLYVQTPLQAALQALDRPMSALLNGLFGAIVKITLIYILITKTTLGITGAALSLNVYILVVTLLHWRSVKQLTAITIPRAELLHLCHGMIVMGLACHLIYRPNDSWFRAWANMPDLLRFFTALSVGTILFLFVMIKTKMVDKHDVIRFLPKKKSTVR